MQFLSDGTDAAFTGLFFLQPFLKKIFQNIKFLPAGLIGTNVESVELALMLKDVWLEHLVEKVGVFWVNICCSYGIEYGFALVESIVEKLLLRKLNPFSVINQEALLCALHSIFKCMLIWLVK